MEEIKINMGNLSDKEREQLMALVKKANKTKGFNEGDKYWFINGASVVYESIWRDDIVDHQRYALGNIFKTSEECKEELERRKIVTKFKRLSIEAGEEEDKWGGSNEHWRCHYCYYNKEVDYDCWLTSKSDSIYFPTKESLQNAIKEIGEDNVKKYILGVKE